MPTHTNHYSSSELLAENSEETQTSPPQSLSKRTLGEERTMNGGKSTFFKIVFLVVLTLNYLAVLAQEKAEIKIIARAQKKNILLRWAPTKAVTWQYANKYGYTLERYTVLRDSALLTQVEKITIGTFFHSRCPTGKTK